MATQQAVLKKENYHHAFGVASTQLISELAALKKRAAAVYDTINAKDVLKALKIEMDEFKDYIISAFEEARNLGLNLALKYVFFKTTEYFNSWEKLNRMHEVCLLSLSPAGNKTALEAARIIKETNCSVLEEIYTSTKSDTTGEKYQQTVARYLAMLQDFLSWMFNHIGDDKALERASETVWATFEASL